VPAELQFDLTARQRQSSAGFLAQFTQRARLAARGGKQSQQSQAKGYGLVVRV